MNNQSISVYLIKTDNIRKNSAINDAVDDINLNNCIISSQNTYIQPIIGTTLLNRLYDDVYKYSISGISLQQDYLNLLENYIYPVLINHVVYLTLKTSLSVKILNSGVANMVDNNTIQKAEIADKQELKEFYLDLAEFYREQLKKYLHDNYLKYPEWQSPNTDYSDIQPDKDFLMTRTSGILFRKKRC